MSELTANKSTVDIDNVVIRFAGDSGDGMQLTGSQFTSTTAFLGNDVVTLPDYPAMVEIGKVSFERSRIHCD